MFEETRIKFVVEKNEKDLHVVAIPFKIIDRGVIFQPL